MPLPALHVLVGVVAVRFATLLGGLNALGIHYRCRCIRVLTYSLPLSVAQGPVKESPRSAKAQFSEVVVNGRPRREVVGQKSPRTAASEDIEDGVEDIT